MFDIFIYLVHLKPKFLQDIHGNIGFFENSTKTSGLNREHRVLRMRLCTTRTLPVPNPCFTCANPYFLFGFNQISKTSCLLREHRVCSNFLRFLRFWRIQVVTSLMGCSSNENMEVDELRFCQPHLRRTAQENVQCGTLIKHHSSHHITAGVYNLVGGAPKTHHFTTWISDLVPAPAQNSVFFPPRPCSCLMRHRSCWRISPLTVCPDSVVTSVKPSRPVTRFFIKTCSKKLLNEWDEMTPFEIPRFFCLGFIPAIFTWDIMGWKIH